MIERLISFAAADGGGYGAVAIDGSGAAAAWLTQGADTAATALSDAPIERGEGSLRIGEGLVVGLAAQTSPLGFETGRDRGLTLQAIGASVESGGAGFEGLGISWSLAGERDQLAFRSAWAAIAGGDLLVVFGLRGPEAEGHGGETVGAVRIGRGGAVRPYTEPLLSTEYDRSGAQTRATLELWGGGEDEESLAERGGGVRVAGGSAELGDGILRAARFAWRVEGEPGVGGYDLFST